MSSAKRLLRNASCAYCDNPCLSLCPSITYLSILYCSDKDRLSNSEQRCLGKSSTFLQNGVSTILRSLDLPLWFRFYTQLSLFWHTQLCLFQHWLLKELRLLQFLDIELFESWTFIVIWSRGTRKFYPVAWSHGCSEILCGALCALLALTFSWFCWWREEWSMNTILLCEEFFRESQIQYGGR